MMPNEVTSAEGGSPVLFEFLAQWPAAAEFLLSWHIDPRPIARGQSQMSTKAYRYHVRFEKGSTEIFETEMEGVNQGIFRWPGLSEHRVRVVGHADAENEACGIALLRAEAVFRYLLDHKIEITRIDPITAYRGTIPQRLGLGPMLRMVMVEFYNSHTGIPTWNYVSIFGNAVSN